MLDISGIKIVRYISQSHFRPHQNDLRNSKYRAYRIPLGLFGCNYKATKEEVIKGLKIF